MPECTLLNGTWDLCHFDGYGETYDHRHVSEALANRVWIEATVPGSAYLDLMRAGWIGDVLADCNTLAAQWVETQFWYYRRRFDAAAVQPGERVFLLLDSVDLDAAVFLNGQYVGEHHNVFRPCRLDVTEALHSGENELIVRVDAGLIASADRAHGPFNTETAALITKRALLRKPQYACRWDWSPRLMNVGIGGDVALQRCATVRVDNVGVTCELEDGQHRATLRVRAHADNVTEVPQVLTLTARVDGTAECGTTEVTLNPGTGCIECAVVLDDPQLWWPRGHGEQHLYDVRITLRAASGESITERTRSVGVRSVRIEQPLSSDGGTSFHLVVNGRPIFCKGACWVPPHLIYSATPADDYAELVALAVECEMNMLRIWGGGVYAPPALLDACDQAGILIWHDFIFACSKYPGDEVFLAEVAAEARHAIRERIHHASLAVWCGNNEIELGVADGWITSTAPEARPCKPWFYDQLAQIVADEDPSRPYVPTTPFTPDGGYPNDPRSGTQHPWLVALGPPKGDYWAYREDSSRFCIEGGMLGPSTMKTLHEILPDQERHVASRTWLHHDNSQNTWRGESMLDNLLRVNLLAEPRALNFADYVRYAGVLHGEALETGIDNWRRRKFDSAAAVFWMFNDTWPATVSWTPIDYARRRKTAFWYVKRAFAEVRTICVELPGELAVFVINDRPQPIQGTLRYGLFALAGDRPVDEEVRVECAANSATVAARLPLDHWDKLGIRTHGAFAYLHDTGAPVTSHRLFRARFKSLEWTPAAVSVTRQGDLLRLRSETFAWAVCVETSGEHALETNYVDLIPGLECTIAWPTELPTPSPQPMNPPF